MAANWGKKEDHKAILATTDSEGVTTAVWRWLPARERKKTTRSSLATAGSDGVMTAVWRWLLTGGRQKTTRPP